jgi:cytochrome c peroxidase
MFGDVPVELGLKGREAELLDRLRAVSVYQALFRESFPGPAEPFTLPNVTRAIAAFQRTILSFNAPVDRFRRGEVGALTESARRGELLFAQRGCPQCHFGSLFTRGSDPSAAGDEFANTGLYNVGGTGAYPGRNVGLLAATGRPHDMGRMRIPSLRNVALTFPYGHDGSVGSLDDVIDNYARGGRLVAAGPNAGDGRENPFRDPRLRPFPVTPQERADLVAFLRALTDSSIVTNPRWSNPWR